MAETLTHPLVQDGWFKETGTLWPGQAMTLEVKEILHVEKSLFQDVLPNPATNLFTFNYPNIDAKSKAAFAQGSIPIIDDLRLELGVRYSKDDKSRTGYLDYGTGIAPQDASSSSSKTPSKPSASSAATNASSAAAAPAK